MSQARTNRRKAKQMRMDNAHLTGIGIPRYHKQKSAAARQRKIQRLREKAARMGRSYGYAKK